MKRFIPWYEIGVFGTIGLVAFLFALSFTFIIPGDSFPAIIALWAVCGGMIVLAGVMIIQKYFAPPDYITRQGVSVWTEIREKTYLIPTLTDVEKFIDLYIDYVPEVLSAAPGLQDAEKHVTSQQLTKMFREINLLFTRKQSALTGAEWWVKDNGCAHRKNLIAVKYFSPFTSMHIYHALFHAIDALVLNREPDVNHKNEAWWATLEVVQAKLEEKIYGASPFASAVKKT